MTLPRKIHYCWFGGKALPLQAKRCLASWALRLPDYELLRWDESNFNPERHPFTAAAYKAGRYAFVSDYVRMQALSQHGGIYLDTDVEVFASLDTLLETDFFIGLEDQQRFATCIIGAKVGHWLPEAMLSYYNNAFFNESFLKELVNVNEVSRLLMAHGFSGAGGNEQLGNERVLEIGMLAVGGRKHHALPAKPLTRHLYAASWNRRGEGKGLLSRIWRKIRKLPSLIEAYGTLQLYRIKQWRKF